VLFTPPFKKGGVWGRNSPQVCDTAGISHSRRTQGAKPSPPDGGQGRDLRQAGRRPIEKKRKIKKIVAADSHPLRGGGVVGREGRTDFVPTSRACV